MHNFSANIPRSYKDVYISSIFSRTVRLWNCLPAKCSPLIYDLICNGCSAIHGVDFSKKVKNYVNKGNV